MQEVTGNLIREYSKKHISEIRHFVEMEKTLGRFSSRYLKEVFGALPPLAKLLLIFALVNAIVIVSTISVRIVSFGNMATIKAINVGVYWDENCTIPVDESPWTNSTSDGEQPRPGSSGIDWGFLGPGETKKVDVYVKNDGNTECTLDIYSEEWSPELAAEYIGFTTDYQGQALGTEVEENVLRISLILHVSVNIQDVTSFQFQIVIQATG